MNTLALKAGSRSSRHGNVLHTVGLTSVITYAGGPTVGGDFHASPSGTVQVPISLISILLSILNAPLKGPDGITLGVPPRGTT